MSELTKVDRVLKNWGLGVYGRLVFFDRLVRATQESDVGRVVGRIPSDVIGEFCDWIERLPIDDPGVAINASYEPLPRSVVIRFRETLRAMKDRPKK